MRFSVLKYFWVILFFNLFFTGLYFYLSFFTYAFSGKNGLINVPRFLLGFFSLNLVFLCFIKRFKGMLVVSLLNSIFLFLKFFYDLVFYFFYYVVFLGEEFSFYVFFDFFVLSGGLVLILVFSSVFVFFMKYFCFVFREFVK